MRFIKTFGTFPYVPFHPASWLPQTFTDITVTIEGHSTTTKHLRPRASNRLYTTPRFGRETDSTSHSKLLSRMADGLLRGTGKRNLEEANKCRNDHSIKVLLKTRP